MQTSFGNGDGDGWRMVGLGLSLGGLAVGGSERTSGSEGGSAPTPGPLTTHSVLCDPQEACTEGPPVSGPGGPAPTSARPSGDPEV